MIVLLLVLYAVLASTLGQNIETRRNILIRPTGGSSYKFGSDLAIETTGSTTNFLYIGAPTYGIAKNRVLPGTLFMCRVNGESYGNSDCSSKIDFGDTGALGSSLAKEANNLNLVVCGPQKTIECTTSKKVLGVCYAYQRNRNVNLLQSAGPTECPRNGLEVDIMFVVDESGSVGKENFAQGLRWIQNVLSSFRESIDSGGANVGMVTYNTQSQVDIPLQQRTFESLSTAVVKVPYSGGGTYTDLGINSAIDEFILRGRLDVPKLMIVIADGKTVPSRQPELRNVLANAGNRGILRAAVGVGNLIDINELNLIAGDNNRVFQVDDFGSLDSILNDLRKVITETAQSLEGQSSNGTNELTQPQMGFSTHISQDRNLLVGAVGAYDRAGSVFDYTPSGLSYSNTPGYLSDVELQEVIKPENLTALADSYLGYSVTSGRLYGGSIDYVISGSPRYHMKGAVFIYNPKAPSVASSKFTVLHPSARSGLWQLGAYFGHSVCTADVNGDSFDDLLISAPIFSGVKGYDQGRVFAFMNDPTNAGPRTWLDTNYRPQVLQGTNSEKARFGMSLIAAGDIDGNGIGDVIVGAPLDERTATSSGSVYIYYGSNQGLLETRRQKILGRDVESSLIYFGGAVASGDVDRNGYSDIGVGAPVSDRVTVLRSRPIVDVTAIIELIPRRLDILSCATNPRSSCSLIGICFRANHRRRSAPSLFQMDLKVTLDSGVTIPTLKRFVFPDNSFTFTRLSAPVSDTFNCINQTMHLNIEAFSLHGIEGTLEITPSIEFTYDFTQAHKDTLLSSVLDPVKLNRVTSAWQFDTRCKGSQGVCNHDLSIQASYSIGPGSTLVLGQSANVFSVYVTISNIGPDFSYFTKVNVTSGTLILSRLIGSCVSISLADSSPGITVLNFAASTEALKDLMLSGDKCYFTLEYSLSSLVEQATTNIISIQGIIYSNAGSSQVAVDNNPQNNRFVYMRDVLYSAILQLSGSSEPDNIVFNRTEYPNAIQTLIDPVLGGVDTNVLHTHVAYNRGPLRVPSVPLHFTWHASTRRSDPLLYLYDFACVPAEKCMCDTNGRINRFNLPTSHVEFPPNVTINFPGPTEALLPRKPSCNDVMCGRISCQVVDIPPFFTITVRAKFKVWLPTLSQENLVTDLSSKIEIDTTGLPLQPRNKVYTTEVSTLVAKYGIPISNVVDTSINIGAIVGGVVAGVVLFAIIVVIMWKLGFFKSKYGERKLQAQRSIRGRPDTAYAEIE